MKMPGPYVPLDVNYARDRAVAAAGEEAELLYVRGLAYCKHTYSDGVIPDHEIDEVGKRLKRLDSRISALVREGLWTKIDGGWLIRGWNRWNETSAAVKEKREREAERQRLRRAAQNKDAGQGDADAERTDVQPPDVQRDTAVTTAHVQPLRQGKAEAIQVPTTSGVHAADVGALIAEFIDHCRERPPGPFVARLGREVKTLVADGTAPDAIRGGLTIVADRGLQPTALPGAVHEHLNARPKLRAADHTTQVIAAARVRAEQAEAEQARKALP